MGIRFASMRRRSFLLAIALAALVPFTMLMLFIGPDQSAEHTLSQRLAEYQMRVQYLESMYRARQEDVAILSQYLGLAASAAATIGAEANTNSNSNSNNGSNSSGLAANTASAGTFLDALSPETRAIVRNLTMSSRFPASLRMPSAFHFLPHLLDDASSLRPAYQRSQGRQGVSVVLGVPTVRRDKQSYLLSTLQNLVQNMDEAERNQSVIVVFIGETDVDYVHLVAKQIELRFGEHLDSGLIEIVSPPASYYPNMEQLKKTLNDPPERVRWRSKQNLDFAFLMAYAQPKGTFYVQLEDDILTKRGFIGIMMRFAYEKTLHKDPWFVLDFCQLGFIGKMFKSAELPWLITFFQMFYNDEPVDWLLEKLIYTKIFNLEKDAKFNKQEKAKLWLHYKPSLFQHIGTASSLKGKTQKLKDKQFGKVPVFYAHHNPAALVQTNITPYKGHTLQRAYAGESFFWGLLPQPGDRIRFRFQRPFRLRRFLFRSGNSEHPSDRLYNTTVEVQLQSPALMTDADAAAAAAAEGNRTTYNSTADGFLIVGEFDAVGVAEGVLDTRLGNVIEVRLHVHSDSENWAILSEIWLQNNLNDRR